MRGKLLLGVLVAFGAVGCRTNVALVDDTFGHERVHAGRFAHVRTARAPLDARGAELRFVLDIALENDRDEPWAVRVDAFHLRADGAVAGSTVGGNTVADCATPRLDLPVGAILATLAARTDVDVRLPIVITLAADMTVHDIERVPILLTLTEDGTDLLHRRLVVGSYSQTGQLIRVVALTTAGLLLISLF